MGMIERYGGEVRAMRVRETTRKHLQDRVRANVEAGSTIYTDTCRSYNGLDTDYVHYVINHAQKYVEGHIHTNTIENVWSCLKRTLTGTYIAPRPDHLDAYLDEQVFRFNNRDDKDAVRFEKVMKGADGKRLTYKALIGKPK